MNFQNQIILLGFILFLLILLSLSAIDPIPYSPHTLFPNHYTYEGFGFADNAGIYNDSSAVTGNAVAGEKPLVTGKPVSEEKPVGVSTSKPVEGFQGLQSSAYGSETPLDIYSQLKSGPACEPSPYSNSEGYLCLDGNAKDMLTSRGGNATGRDSQIGSP